MVPALLLALILPAPAAAQEYLVAAGIVAYQQRDYAKARGALETALADPGSLREDRRSRAELYLARTLWQHVTRDDLEVPDGARARTLDLLQACAAGHERWRDDCAKEAEYIAYSLVDRAAQGEQAAADALVAAWPESWLGPYARGAAGLVEDAAFDSLFPLFTDAWERVVAGAEPGRPALILGVFDITVRTHGAVHGPEAGLAFLEAQVPKLRARLGDDGWSTVEADVAELRGSLARTVEQVRRYRAAAEAPDATATQLVEWAAVLTELGQLEQAAVAYETATTRHPDDATAWFDRGVFHYNQAAALDTMAAMKPHMARARPALERAVALDPDNDQAVAALRQACQVLEDAACLAAVDAAAGE